MLAWQDALHEGPIACVPAPEFRELRAGFLAECGWGSARAIAEEMRRRDELLAHALTASTSGRALVRARSLRPAPAAADPRGDTRRHGRLRRADPVGRAPRAARCAGTRGALAVEGPVTSATIELGHRAWRAVCSTEIETVLAEDTRASAACPALRRLLEERAPLGARIASCSRRSRTGRRRRSSSSPPTRHARRPSSSATRGASSTCTSWPNAASSSPSPAGLSRCRRREAIARRSRPST